MNAGCGPQQQQPFAHYDPHTFSWKTSQLSFEMPELSEPFYPTFTASGSMRNGQLFERPTLVRRPHVDGFTCWPTPRGSMGSHMIAWKRVEAGDHRYNLEDYLASMYMDDDGLRQRGLNVNPEWTDWLMGFPTNHSALTESETPSCRPSSSTSGA